MKLSTILIVDDGPLGRATLDGLLRAGSYQLAFAENGAAALTMASQIKPDLVLLDVMMSGIDGFEVWPYTRRPAARPDPNHFVDST